MGWGVPPIHLQKQKGTANTVPHELSTGRFISWPLKGLLGGPAVTGPRTPEPQNHSVDLWEASAKEGVSVMEETEVPEEVRKLGA